MKKYRFFKINFDQISEFCDLWNRRYLIFFFPLAA